MALYAVSRQQLPASAMQPALVSAGAACFSALRYPNPAFDSLSLPLFALGALVPMCTQVLRDLPPKLGINVHAGAIARARPCCAASRAAAGAAGRGPSVHRCRYVDCRLHRRGVMLVWQHTVL